MKSNIPYYKSINDFLESIQATPLANNPHLHCLRLKKNDNTISVYKPPFRKDFFFIGLVCNAGESKITYDNTNVTKLNSFLVFQTPGLLYSFYRDRSANGYLIYFKKECLSFFKPDFEKEFPFFNILQTNFFKLNEAKFQEFVPLFEEVFKNFEQSGVYQYKIATIKFLILLYQLKEYTSAFKQWEEGFVSPQQILFQRFTQLVNNFYLEKRTIDEYAVLLSVSANHLSQSIKSATSKNALSFINDRLLMEAKTLIQFTEMDIAQIAYQLNFSDPANFGKFFKKHTGMTPLGYRKQIKK